MKRTLFAAAMAAAVVTAPAMANDTTAELAAGGLVFTKTDAIEMKSEDLYVSAEAVRVKYRFLNTSGTDVTTRVAFPMPDIGGESLHYSPSAIPDREAPANILDFVTTVDGKAVKMEVEQKALVKGVDRTAWLTSRKVPLGVHLDSTVKALDALSKADQDKAIALGLAMVDEYETGGVLQRHLIPIWILKTTFHWEQTFPAGRELVVEHRYKPGTGGSAGTMVGSPGFAGTPEWPQLRNRYCIDTEFLGAVAKAKGKQDWPPFSEARIAYVLKTGGNWAKPIGDFRMVIDKGDAKNLVSFCAEGVKKISPTQFEVRKTNWTPPKDLNVLILLPVNVAE